MSTQTDDVNGSAVKPDYDTIVIGAGFAGLRIIPELRKLKHSFKVIEAGSDIGGTWYWNRYPGARTDSEAQVYILNFSKEMNAEWTWSERFPRQPEVLKYLNYVADRFDMRKDIQFNTRIKTADYDERTGLWTLSSDEESLKCRYFISASGILSIGRELPFKGAENFKGESYRSYAWPKEEVSFKGKRVAVIGTGATAVQIIPTIAYEAESLTVFQRTANWVLPARNHALMDEQNRDFKARQDEVWQQARGQIFGMPFVDTQNKMMDQDDKRKIRAVLECGFEQGGFRYIFETYADLLTSKEANEVACDFLREKYHAIVQDEETAELLCPDHVLMAKRPPLGHHYFQTFNRPNVKLVSLKDNPIKEITDKGVVLEKPDPRFKQSEFEFDVIVYGIGFDAATGPLSSIEIRGTDKNTTLGQEWSENLATFLGITVTGYPNLFMISGPQSPFANIPIIIDNTGDWISQLLHHMENKGYHQVVPKQEAVDQWTKLLTDVYDMTVLPESAKNAGSWYAGANIPGKQVRPLFWFGGVPSYFQMCKDEVQNNFPSLVFA
ncbi:putative cyclohexanone monooxygenase [Acrodontium crateriforme]|uniref:Cyclohexanone monooxygenase n=1 Tax=Acrodontium crateriforme TaxID=150365 RepID=A0AAQ3LZX2_9PEZI|nr:putative cyclohexanone monooxygenase [Acrodontium crateriforme]